MTDLPEFDEPEDLESAVLPEDDEEDEEDDDEDIEELDDIETPDVD